MRVDEKRAKGKDSDARSPLSSFVVGPHDSFFKEPKLARSIMAQAGSPLNRSSSVMNMTSRNNNSTIVADTTTINEKSINLLQNSSLHTQRLTTSNKALNVGDRFLPAFGGDSALIHDRIFSSADDRDQASFTEEASSADTSAVNKLVSEAFIGADGQNRILTYCGTLPQSSEAGSSNAVKFQTKANSKPIQPGWLKKRFIPKAPERVLDAPDLKDDYYLNLLHWGGKKIIAVGLANDVFLWNSVTGDITKLETRTAADDASDYVCSVKWAGNEDCSCLAVGRSSGVVQLWDVRRNKCLRNLRQNSSRVTALSWNRHILTSGAQNGKVVNFDVRVAQSLISENSECHEQAICSLSWSPDGRHLASGGNDNVVNVWNTSQATAGSIPMHVLPGHIAAIKAMDWHPNEANILATGGGTADGNIIMWNAYNGVELARIETHSQVSGLLWSPHYNELISSHGYPYNRLTIWNYPSMNVVTHLSGHSQRILGMCLNTDGTTVASVGADETLRLWRCFDVPKSSRKENSSITKSVSATLIR